MQRRAVFVDVDGTLVNDRGLVPPTASEAIRGARANGHLVLLCTGRSTGAIWPEILQIGFDGVVAAAGGYVELDGLVLSHHHVPTEQVLRVSAYFDAHGVEYLLESNDGLHGSPGVRSRMRQLLYAGVTDEDVLAELERGLAGFIDSVVVGGDPTTLHVNKFSFLDSALTLEEIRAELGDTFDVIPATVPLLGPNRGERSLRGVHKAAGIQVVIDHLGMDRARTVAFGDGFNDLEMLEFAGVGVAMGGAHPDVLAHADHITGSPDEDGIRDGFSALGLI